MTGLGQPVMRPINIIEVYQAQAERTSCEGVRTARVGGAVIEE